ncbi:hypothetical protein WA158_004352 [Blastocystis sp. Blastoise]
MFRFSKVATKGFVFYTGLAIAGGVVYWSWDTIRATAPYAWCVDASMPMMRMLNPEMAHKAGVLAAKYHLSPIDKSYYPELSTDACGMHFPNCVGLAAGFDKNAVAINSLHEAGFGFIEVGGVTPKAQPGNPSPRMFRLSEYGGIINRFGLNNEGHTRVVPRLRTWYDKYHGKTGLLGVNLAENKGTEDSVNDYVQGIKNLGPYSDFVVINVSCPNQVGTLELQAKEHLDLNDGIVVSNTTTTRPEYIKDPALQEKGGLSGTPVKELSTQSIKDMYYLTKGKINIIGVGGISNAQDAYEKIKAGASVVEVYTALVYNGIGLVASIKKDLATLLAEDGFEHVSQAVGKDVPLD